MQLTVTLDLGASIGCANNPMLGSRYVYNR